MKTLFTFILVFFFIPSFSQIVQKLDSISDYDGYQSKLFYNLLNKNTDDVTLKWDSDSLNFIPEGKNSFVYDENGNCLQRFYLKYDKNFGTWNNYSKVDIKYDSNSNIIQSWTYQWSDSMWTQVARIDHENIFNENNLLTNHNLHEYNENGYELTEYIYSYNKHGELSELSIIGNDNSKKHKFNFRNDTIQNFVEVIKYDIGLGGWKPNSKIEFLYDENIRCETIIKSFFYESHVFSYPHSLYTRLFTVDNPILIEKRYSIVNMDEWKFSNERRYHYKQVVATNIPELRNDKIHVFPNPATYILNIVLPDNIQNATLDIYSMNGQKTISQQLHDSNNRISVNHLNPGVYLYQIITADNQVVKGKLVKK